MLTFGQLKRYYPDSVNIPSKNLLVEYLQYEILDSLYKQKESAYLSFIGGTAIRIVYGGNRFSEDLDFDNFGLSFADFQHLMDKIVEDMKIKGFLMDARLVQKGAYHCYIRFPHILQAANLSDIKGEKILVRVDATWKEKILEPVFYTLNRFDIYRNILVNPENIILSQKMMAILGRKREKGRDFFDVSYLYGMTKPDFSYIEKIMGISREEFVANLLAKCDALDFKSLAKDVEPFLMNPEQISRVLGFREFIYEMSKRGI